MKKIFTLLLLGICYQGYCQQPPMEFDKGMVLNLELLQGFTKAKSMPELYLADLRLSPQWTIAPGVLRAGVTGGVLYNSSNLSAFGGPNLALNLKTVKAGEMGSLLNVQFVVEHLWGSDKQRLLGGGFRTEIGKKLLLSVLTHRDYNLNYWNAEFGVGINFLRKKVSSTVID
jgi:hypothetical protein